jgi:hypothetical protein
MKWTLATPTMAVSCTTPEYRVVRSGPEGEYRYRPSVGGEFIGQVCKSAREALSICENHLMIVGTATSEVAHG